MDVLAAKGVVASVTLPTMSRCAHRKAMSSTPDIAWKKSSRDSDLVCGDSPALYKTWLIISPDIPIVRAGYRKVMTRA